MVYPFNRPKVPSYWWLVQEFYTSRRCMLDGRDDNFSREETRRALIAIEARARAEAPIAGAIKAHPSRSRPHVITSISSNISASYIHIHINVELADAWIHLPTGNYHDDHAAIIPLSGGLGHWIIDSPEERRRNINRPDYKNPFFSSVEHDSPSEFKSQQALARAKPREIERKRVIKISISDNASFFLF